MIKKQGYKFINEQLFKEFMTNLISTLQNVDKAMSHKSYKAAITERIRGELNIFQIYNPTKFEKRKSQHPFFDSSNQTPKTSSIDERVTKKQKAENTLLTFKN